MLFKSDIKNREQMWNFFVQPFSIVPRDLSVDRVRTWLLCWMSSKKQANKFYKYSHSRSSSKRFKKKRRFSNFCLHAI